MAPFFIVEDRPMPRPVPAGWAVKTFGEWDGAAVALAYDPRRYQVMLAHGVRRVDVDQRVGKVGATVEALTTAGWAPFAFDYANGRSLWLRDLRTVALAEPRPPSEVAAAPIGLER